MLEVTQDCAEFQRLIHRYLDTDMELVEQAAIVAHVAACGRCRDALLQYNRHIQAHRVLAAGGRLDGESVRTLERVLPSEFSRISEQVVRRKARELGKLKLQILEVYLKAMLDEHAWGTVLTPAQLEAAQNTSHALLDNLERFKESEVIFADGGLVDLHHLRERLDSPLAQGREGLEPQLWAIAHGLLSARTLDPSLDEYVLHHLGVILERLGHFREARQMFLALSRVTPRLRPHLRAQALNSAGSNGFRYLGLFREAEAELLEASRLWPNRWTIEYNLAYFYLWPQNPARDLEKARSCFEACQRHASPDKLDKLISRDPMVLRLFQQVGFMPA